MLHEIAINIVAYGINALTIIITIVKCKPNNNLPKNEMLFYSTNCNTYKMNKIFKKVWTNNNL